MQRSNSFLLGWYRYGIMCVFACALTAFAQTPTNPPYQFNPTFTPPVAIGGFTLVNSAGASHSLEHATGTNNGAALINITLAGEHSNVRLPADKIVRIFMRMPQDVVPFFFKYDSNLGTRKIAVGTSNRIVNLISGANSLFDQQRASGWLTLHPKTLLEPGEYCISTPNNNKDLYCFGVDAPGDLSEAQQGKLQTQGTGSQTETVWNRPGQQPKEPTQNLPIQPSIGTIDEKTDIYGLNLTMTPAQVRAYVRAKHPAAKDIKLPVELAFSGSNRDIVEASQLTEHLPFTVGEYFSFDVNAKYQRVGEDMEQHPAFLGEYVTILYAPVKDNIVEIIHYKGYNKTQFLTRDSVIQALIKKYGNPVAPPNGFRTNNLIWVARADVTTSVVRSDLSSSISVTDIQYNHPPHDGSKGCGLPKLPRGFSQFSNTHGFLYEHDDDVDSDGISTYASPMWGAFAVNLRNSKKLEGCGLVFEVGLSTVREKGEDIVTGITEKIVDFDKASAELQEFSNDLDRKYQEDRDKKMKSNSAKHPEL